MNWTRFISSILGVGLLATSVLFPVRVSAGQTTATLRRDNDILQGTSLQNRPLLYAPGIVAQGSSVSHWDTSATPNLLMEPFISNDLPFLGLDITPQLMQDIGWEMGNSTFNIIDEDEEGTGFTDPSPFPGASGNPATTLGEARQNLFAAVLGAWAATLQSDIDVDVLVTWQPLSCDPDFGATLAAAGSLVAVLARGEGILPEVDTLYHVALAEALLGTQISGDPSEDGNPDIFVVVNSAIDEGCLGEGSAYYYGLDAEQPEGLLGLAPTILHELGHGLGFSNFTFEVDGSQGGPFPSIFDHSTFDETQDRNWVRMGDQDRQRSAINDKALTWSGPAVFQTANTTLDPGTVFLEVNDQTPLFATPALFGAPITEMGTTGGLACAFDAPLVNVDSFPFLPSTRDGCDMIANPGDLTGNLVLVDRGNCSFVTKAANLQAAGAAGVLIVNNFDLGLTAGFAGDASGIDIPVAGLSLSQGQRLRSQVCPSGPPPSLIFAQWLNGEIGGQENSVRVLLNNQRGLEDTGTISFQDAGGGLVSPQGGGIEPIPYVLPPFGTFSFRTPGTGPLQSGVIEVRSDRGPASSIVGTEIFEVLGKPVSVPSSTPGQGHRIFVSVGDGDNTGTAFYNPHPELWTRVLLFLYDSQGQFVDINVVELAPRQQIVGFLTEERFFGQALQDFPDGFEGTMEAVIDSGPGFAMLGLIQLPAGSLISVETTPLF